MRIVDTSVLLPAVSPSLPQHDTSRNALEAAINDERPLGLTWVVVNAFLRLTTKPGLFERPLTIAGASDLVNDWLIHPGVRVVRETEENPRLWSELLRGAGTGGDLTTDVWIAAIALAHGATALRLDLPMPRAERKLAAILSADAVGYSRLMGADESGTVAVVTRCREIVEAIVPCHGGRLVDFTGDNFLAEFPAATDGIDCAREVLRAMDSLARAAAGLDGGARVAGDISLPCRALRRGA